MPVETLGFALVAGTLAAVNPCGFAMLPAYLSFFIVGADPDERPSAGVSVGRALTATAAMTVGFVAVFATFGLVLTPVASTVQRWLPLATVTIGVVLIGLGLRLLAGHSISLRLPFLRLSHDPTASPGTMALYGVSYAVASLGCTIGPFLVVTATTFRAGNLAAGVIAFVAYAVGMGLVVGVLAVGAALVGRSTAGTLRRLAPVLGRLSGALLVLVGAYVSWYGWYELRVFAGQSGADPVISAASALQSRLARAVDVLGPPTFAVALALLAGSAVVIKRRRTARAGRGGDR